MKAFPNLLPLCSKGGLETLLQERNLNAAAVTDTGLSRKIHPEHRYVKVVCLSLYCISFLYSWIISIIRCCYSGCSIRLFCMGLSSICCLAVLWFVTAEVTAGWTGRALSVPLWSQHTPANRGAPLKMSAEISLYCTCWSMYQILLPFHPLLEDILHRNTEGLRETTEVIYSEYFRNSL